MNRILMTGIILIIVFSTSAFSQDIEGLWKSINEEGEVTAIWQLESVGGLVRGQILKIAGKPDSEIAEKVDSSYPGHPQTGLNAMRVIDVFWIYNMSPRRGSSTEYTGGHIIDPEDGKRYALDLNVLPPDHRKAVNDMETLEVKGKIAIFSRSQYWVRASAEDLARL
jgi:uncharacterized protein (DUF2147 family)